MYLQYSRYFNSYKRMFSNTVANIYNTVDISIFINTERISIKLLFTIQ